MLTTTVHTVYVGFTVYTDSFLSLIYYNKSMSQMSFAREGVTLKLLRSIGAIVKSRNCDWTTTDVNVQLVKPMTQDRQSSLAAMLKSVCSSVAHPELKLTYEEAISPCASIFVSHAWQQVSYFSF